MIRLPRTALLAVILVLALVSSGCATIRTTDTHNTTVAVQSFNAWVTSQNELDRELRGSVTTIGDHIAMYNTEIARENPDYALIRNNLREDQALLDRWGTRLDTLSEATDRFERETSGLTYDNATVQRTREHLAVMTRFMRIYAIDLGNARQHLIEYVRNAEAYVADDDPEYWNEEFRADGAKARDNAIAAMAEGDMALNDLLREAKELERLQ